MDIDESGRWKDALIVDRDELLIAAAARWLGPIRTPFNKHDIVARIEAFLRRPETSRAVVDLLDRTDRRILTLVMMVGGSEGLPGGDLTLLASDNPEDDQPLLRRLRNLRERLVLFTFAGPDGMDRYAVTPALAPAIAAAVQASDVLSAWRPYRPEGGADPATAGSSPGENGPSVSVSPVPADPGPGVFAAFCAFVSAATQAKPAYRTKSEPTRRMAALLESAGHGLASGGDRLPAMLDALTRIGVAGIGDDGRPFVDPRAFVDLCDRFGTQTLYVLVAAGVPWERLGCDMDPLLVRCVLEGVPSGLLLSAQDLVRTAALSVAAARTVTGSGWHREGLARTLMALVESMRKLGVLLHDGNGLFRCGSIDSGPATSAGLAERSAQVVVEASHELRIMPEAGLNARAFVAAIARMESLDVVWRAQLDRSAARTAFACGFGAAEIMDRLSTLSGAPLPQSVRFSLEAWESEVKAVRVRTGVVVALDGHLSGLFEHSEVAARIVRERLAPGVYLLAARDAADAERLLKSAGIDVDVRDGATVGMTGASQSLYDTGFGWSGMVAETHRPVFAPPVKTDAPLRRSLLSALDASDLVTEARAEMAGRIHAGLVLDASAFAVERVVATPVPSGEQSAAAKTRLIEKAIKDGSPVIICWTDARGVPVRCEGVARSLRRTTAGAHASFSTVADGPVEIPVSAIVSLERPDGTPIGV